MVTITNLEQDCSVPIGFVLRLHMARSVVNAVYDVRHLLQSTSCFILPHRYLGGIQVMTLNQALNTVVAVVGKPIRTKQWGLSEV